MSLPKSLEKALNQQIGIEFEASYTYLSMAAWFDAQSWDGFSTWMSTQSDEERVHAMKFYNYLLDRGANVKLPAIKAPDAAFDSPLGVFQASLKQEQSVTATINKLYKLALETDDFATVSFLKWFVDEQVEEEKIVSDMIEKLKRAGNKVETLLLLDQAAGARSSGGGGE
ncbi:MAG: ferritin [Verrucomicrobiae bacterium]|nr:ferritin [Verrucomicrobiae bacterium]